MNFKFIIACHIASDTDIHQILVELLALALGDLEDDSVRQMIELTHRRVGHELDGADGETIPHTLISFTVDLPDVESPQSIMDDFAFFMRDTDAITHVIKFEDSLLQTELAERALEIYQLEMKLRRVLSFVYLHAYRSEDPYNLLRDELTKPSPRQLETEHMKAAIENQFFHLSFNQYINLNNRPQPNSTELMEMIRSSEDYEALRDELARIPISNDGDASLLSDLKRLMNPIEEMRNCVAHNRMPSRRISEDYVTAHPQLEERLNDFLSNLQWPDEPDP